MSLKKLALLIIVIVMTIIVAISCKTQNVMRGALREDRVGWIFVHLEGTSREIGYQHGRLLAAEIDGLVNALAPALEQATGRDWSFYREAAETILWPKVDRPVRMEIEGLAEGLRAGQPGLKYDKFDIAALNGWMELAWYYVPVLDAKTNGAGVESKAPPSCSAFIATGSYTSDGGIVAAHNIWMDYIAGARWNVILDIKPDTGRRMLMDALPGFVHSGSDFAFNDAGLFFTETTIAGFAGFKKDGVPSFVRSRNALQYGESIDDFIRIMTENGNGAMANDWLVGDFKTNEIARLELGLKNHRIWRTNDGYFVGANFPSDEKLIAEETAFDPNNAGQSVYIRRDRWEQLMAENKGKIDIDMAIAFIGDHVDPRTGEPAAGADRLCGHVDQDPKGAPEFAWPPFFPGGSANGKAVSADLGREMKFWAR
ncbi:MAG: peptidase C45, partial [Candidatus Aminicenantes bacterium]|nr:peptidase C45 [Candidatus Aminicenantes bacterium]